MQQSKIEKRWIPLILALFLILYSLAKFIMGAVQSGFGFFEALGYFFNWMNVVSIVLTVSLPLFLLVATKNTPNINFLRIIIFLAGAFILLAVIGAFFINSAKLMLLNAWGATLYNGFMFIRGSGIITAATNGNAFGVLTEVFYLINYFMIIVIANHYRKEQV